jgi:hypothetical protein
LKDDSIPIRPVIGSIFDIIMPWKREFAEEEKKKKKKGAKMKDNKRQQ